MSSSKKVARDENVFKAPYYDHGINFQTLSNENRDFRDCLVSNHGLFDFKNPDHLRCLTKALLLRDFNLQLHLPENRLCPPVPIRWLYVQWIHNLIDFTSPALSTRQEASGIDIGVGASCIYPLLLCASRPAWRMCGSDVDETNFQHAVHNVAANELDDRIKLVKTTQADSLIPMKSFQLEKLDFTMCNPPFFATKEEAIATFKKESQPFSACTGADIEMITPGGEVAYVSRMVDESLVLKDRIQWYTVQLGKLSSLHAIIHKLKEVGCRNWVVSVLQPSGQTVRWAIGWSWSYWRAPDVVARHKSLVGTNLQMEPNENRLTLESIYSDPQDKLHEILSSIPFLLVLCTVHPNTNVTSMVIRCDSAVWSRAARRRREREEAEAIKNGENLCLPLKFKWSGVGMPPEFAYIFALDIHMNKGKDGDETISWALKARWVKGEDRAIFESFCGMLKTKLISSTGG